MCLLAYYAPGAMPVVKHLQDACYNNPDGFGWAVITNDGALILRGHSMDADTAISDFVAVRQSHPLQTALFHARWATHGVIDETNCHPFRVNGRHDMVMGHNGVLTCQPKAGDPRSDSRILADGLLLGKYRHLDSTKTRKRLEAWLGGSKIVVLTTDPFYRQQAYIFNEDMGAWEGDIWYSNDSYLPRAWSRPTVSGNWWNDLGTDGYTIGRRNEKAVPNDYLFVCEACVSPPEECDCPGIFRGIYIYDGPDGRAPYLKEDFADPDTWVCKACGARGEVDQDTGQCSCCLFMWCCDKDPWECECPTGDGKTLGDDYRPMALAGRPVDTEPPAPTDQ